MYLVEPAAMLTWYVLVSGLPDAESSRFSGELWLIMDVGICRRRTNKGLGEVNVEAYLCMRNLPKE